jgi:hypothetical protein
MPSPSVDSIAKLPPPGQFGPFFHAVKAKTCSSAGLEDYI